MIEFLIFHLLSEYFAEFELFFSTARLDTGRQSPPYRGWHLYNCP